MLKISKKKSRKLKNKLHVITLKMNSLHLTGWVENSWHVDFTCWRQFTLDIASSDLISAENKITNQCDQR